MVACVLHAVRRRPAPGEVGGLGGGRDLSWSWGIRSWTPLGFLLQCPLPASGEWVCGTPTHPARPQGWGHPSAARAPLAASPGAGRICQMLGRRELGARSRAVGAGPGAAAVVQREAPGRAAQLRHAQHSA